MPVLKKNPAERGRALLVALFVVYLVLLIWIVLWKLQLPYVGTGVLRNVKLVPFAAGGGDGASDPLEVVANVALFVPFGLYLALLAPSWRWWKATGVIAGTSLALEVTQYILAVGSSDISDVIANTAGGLVGIGLLVFAQRHLHARTAAVMAGVCGVCTVLAVLAVGLFIASPIRYTPPGDRPPAVSTRDGAP